MSSNSPKLHLLCGKIASGKSTLAAELGEARRTVLISEDDWLAALFADEMSSVADYVRCSAKLRAGMGPHIISLLKEGVSVVLDFPANTIENREWMRGLFQSANVEHELHVLEVPDDACRARLRARNAAGDHAFAATDEQFARISKHFLAPTPDEGFNIVTHRFENGG